MGCTDTLRREALFIPIPEELEAKQPVSKTSDSEGRKAYEVDLSLNCTLSLVDFIS